jgi:Fe(3+) dicitrate transport protein
MKRYFLLSGFLLFFAGVAAWGQPAMDRIQVIAAQTGEPVSKAQVFVNESGQLLEVDREGYATLPKGVEKAYTLTVFADGYTTQTFPLETAQPTIRLETLSIDIEVVEVQAQESQSSLVRLNNVDGVGIYAAKKSEVIQLKQTVGNLGASNAREVYKGIAGLNVWENDGSGLQLNIGARGLDPNRTSNFNTRQNGYDISADALGYPESYYTPPVLALDEIQIVRGAASLQYGTQFGGLLNFVFKKGPEDQKFHWTGEQTIGSFGFSNTFNSVGGQVGKLNYYAFHQYRRGDGWRPNAGFQQHTAFVNTTYSFSPRLKVRLEYTYMDYVAQQPGGLMDFEFAADPRQSKRTRNWFAVNWNLANLSAEYRISDRTRIDTRNFLLVASRSALGDLSRIDRPDPLRERDLIIGDYQNFGNETRLITRYDLGGHASTFLAGVRLYRGLTVNRQGDANDGVGPDFAFLNPDDLERSYYQFPSRNAALFAENLFTITDRLSITPGIRYEYIRTASDGYYKERVFSGGQVIFEQRIEEERVQPRSFLLMGVGLGYRPKKNLELYANFSQNYRAINFSDLAIVNPNLIIDSTLTDESGYNADLGLRGSGWNERFRFDVSAFFLQYRNRIGTSEIMVEDPLLGERAVAYRTNVGDARILGLELFAEADVVKWGQGGKEGRLTVFVNGSALQGAYTSGMSAVRGKQVEWVPPLSFRTGMTARWNGFWLSYLFSYVHEHFSDATNAEFVTTATRGIIPSYQVMDLSVGYQAARWKLSGGVNNLANESYFTRRAVAYPGPGIIPADARNIYLSLGLNFGR